MVLPIKKILFLGLILGVAGFGSSDCLLAKDLSFTEVKADDPSLKAKLENVFTRFLRRELTIQKLRWKFPARYTGLNVQLWEKPGVVMAKAPLVKMTVSLKTLMSFRFRISQLKFIDAIAYLRFTPDGKTNLSRMITDLVLFANRHRKPGQRQKAVYNFFEIKNAQVEVIDDETGHQPFGSTFRVNGKGDIDGLGPQTKFPFVLEAVLVSTSAPMTAVISGTMSNRPQIRVVAQHIPLHAMTAYYPIVRWFAGSIDGDFDFSKAGSYVFWKLEVVAKEIKPIFSHPFPLIKVEGFFHAYSPSVLRMTLLGHPTRFNVVVKMLDWTSKRVLLNVESKGADIQECIRWCRTGFLLNKGPQSIGHLAKDFETPMVWNITGKIDVEGHFASFLSPRLVRELDGYFHFKIQDGVLSEMPGLIKTLTLLNLSSLLVHKSDRPQRLAFGTVKGLVDISDGVARTRDWVVLESTTLDIAVLGQIDFSKQTIDARMLIGIVSVPEDVIQRIPFVRTFGGPKKRGVIPIGLSIQGTLQNPDVQLLSLKTFHRNLWKTLPVPFQIPKQVERDIYK